MGACNVLKFDSTWENSLSPHTWLACPTTPTLTHLKTIMLPPPYFTVATVQTGTYSSPLLLQTLILARVEYSWKLDSYDYIILSQCYCVHRHLALLCFSIINGFFLAIHDLNPCFKSRPRTVLFVHWSPDCSDHCRFSSAALIFLSVQDRHSRM